MRQPPTLPSPTILQRFFRERRPCSIAEAADIVGYSAAWVRKRAAVDGIDLTSGFLPWEDVMLWFLRAWPLPLAEDSVPPETLAYLPALLRTTTVTWRLPRYLVHALDRQTELESVRRRSLLIRVHRVINRPYRMMRRLLFRWLRRTGRVLSSGRN